MNESCRIQMSHVKHEEVTSQAPIIHVTQVAVCCSVVQCDAVCYSVLQCGAVCCSVLQCVAVCCSVLQCVAVCCSIFQCIAVFLDCEVYFENEPQLCRALLQKRPVNVRSLLICKRALYISQKAPCVSARKPCISAKEA